MSNNPTYERINSNSGALPNGVIVETEQQVSGAQRQVVAVRNPADGTALDIDIISSALPTGAATSANQTDNSQKTQIVNSTGTSASVESRKQTPTGNALNVQIGPGDIISNIPVIIDYDHHQLHEGETFRWSVYIPSLAINATKDIRIVVPNITIPSGVSAVARCPHLRWEVVSSTGGVAVLTEGTTFTATGTQRTPLAMERNGTYTSQMQIWEDPTVNVLGTSLWTGLLLSNGKAGDTALPDAEFVLKNNTSYNMRFTSGAASNAVLIRFVWYEDLGV